LDLIAQHTDESSFFNCAGNLAAFQMMMMADTNRALLDDKSHLHILSM